VATDHSRVPFGVLFGDEDYYIKRGLWLRNIALDLPVHRFDLEYAFEPNARSGFLYVLAFVQAFVGPAPYGLRLMSIAFYVSAVLLLYRAMRDPFGRMPALFGLIVLMFLPTLFVWSTAVLKEALFFLVNGVALVSAMGLVRSLGWRRRAIMLLGIAASGAALQGIRPDGAAFVALGTIGGLALGFIVARPRLLLATAIATPILLAAVLRQPQVQLQTYAVVQSAARQHWGAVVVSHGYGYHLLDARFYEDLNSISSLGFGETMRFVTRGIAAYALRPWPWEVQSLAGAAYIPEQIVWYALAALAAGGAVFAFRRDPMVAGLLVAHALLIGVIAAFTDGNFGTLVRHRALALPYLVWLSGVGACEALGAATKSAREWKPA
jgi:hypothetical protein